jgi:hypothetical protein
VSWCAIKRNKTDRLRTRAKIFWTNAAKFVNFTTKRVWKLRASTQLRAAWHTDSLDMLVLPSTGASRYHNCCIDGGISPEYFRYNLVYCNVEARSCNYRCRGEAKIITYSECVSVALVIQHAKRMRRSMLSSVACQALSCFPPLSHKRQDFRKKLLKLKCVFWLGKVLRVTRDAVRHFMSYLLKYYGHLYFIFWRTSHFTSYLLQNTRVIYSICWRTT